MDLLSVPDLSTLSLVNKGTHLLVAPLLYSKFEYRIGEEEPPAFIAFLRTVLARPDLANHVKRLALTGGFFSRDGDRVPTVDTGDFELGTAVRIVDSAGPGIQPFASQWKGDLYRRTLDAFVTLLIAKLPNLRSLRLELYFTKESGILGHYLRATVTCHKEETSITRLSLLRHLEDVSYTHWPCDDIRRQCGRSTQNILPFFYWTGIHDLSVALDNPGAFEWPFLHPPDLSNLRSLSLSYIREHHLSRILAATKRLKHFEWLWYYNGDEKQATNLPIINLNHVASALSFVQDTLEQLNINANDSAFANSGFSPWIDFEGSLRSLRAFPRLERINMPMTFLTGSWGPQSVQTKLQDIVPTCITNLTINDDLDPHHLNLGGDPYQNEWEDDELASTFCLWISGWKSEYPHLKDIAFLKNRWRWWAENNQTCLGDAGRLHGVRIKVMHYDRFKDIMEIDEL